MFHYAEWEWKVLLLYHALCTVLFSHQWMRRHLTALHSTLHQHSLSSCYWLDSGLSVGGHVFWRRRGFGEWFAGRMGSYAFNASLLLLASQKRLSYSLLKLQNPPGFQTHFFDSKLPWQFFYHFTDIIHPIMSRRKPSFWVKIVLSGVICVREIIEYAFVGVSLSDAKCMGGEH